jgi:ATP-binding cassette subfamily B protein
LDVTLAISIGAVLLSYGALRQLSAGFTSVIDAVIAWKRVRILFRASRGADGEDARSSRNDGPAQSASDPVIELRSVSYGFPGHSDPVLKDCDLLIRHGDRLLLEGPSGAGKSTLASLLAGLRQPQLGVLRARGIDHTTIGEHAWRRRVALAPQFHENHVLAETFLFNLLMGRRWPPTAEDIRAATEVCLELGLGPLIDRMPGGVHQFVGDTGWQLSHGERSRLYVARALLQGAELVIFDESFAALDPDTLRQCLACVMKRAPAALLIAHP